ncbi:MAG: tetratricopeptide repeat protein [Bacteroidales bacterium]|nr:tetratricopeptide repeat protein [Bacteroidales bacterium]
MYPFRIVFIISFIFYFVISVSQDSNQLRKIEKLQDKFEQASPTEKLQILKLLSQEYLLFNPEKSHEFSIQAISIALEINDSVLLVKAYQNLGDVLYQLYDYHKAAKTYAKAVEIQKLLPKDSTLVRLLIETGSAYMQASKYDNAEVYLLDAMAISEKFGMDKQLSRVYFSIGNLYYAAGKYQLAVRYLAQAQKEAEEQQDKIFLADIMNNTGIIYSDIGSYEKTLEYYLKSLELFEEMEDKQGIALTLNNIGIVYHDWGNKEKSLEYYQKSLQIEEKLGNELGCAGSYNNIGIVYSEWDQNELAIGYYERALNIYAKFNDSLGIAYVKNNIGESYAALGNYELAYIYLNEALLLEKKYGNIIGVAQSLQTIGEVYFLHKNYQNALINNDKSFKIADSAKVITILKVNHELYYKIYNAQKKFEKALYHFTLFESLKDNEYNDQFLNQLANLQQKHEIDRKEQERKLFKKEYNKKENEEVTQRIYLVIIFALMVVFGILVYYDIKSKINANNKLIKINTELFNQKTILSETLEQLQKNEAKYRNLVENSPTGILYVDNSGYIIEINQKLIQILGSQGEKETRKIHYLEFEPIKKIGLTDEIKNCFKSGEIYSGEKNYITKLGKRVHLKYSIYPIKNQKGDVSSLIINIEDISKTKEVERLKLITEEKYRILVENSLQAMLIIQDARLIFGNSQVEQLTKYKFEELSSRGKYWLKLLIHPDDYKQSIKNVLDALRGRKITPKHEYRILRKDGSTRWIESLGSVVDYMGQPAMLMVAVDITERKNAEQTLLNSEKKLKEANAMKDKFFSIIAHDLKNPFSSIMGFANLLYEAYDNFEERQRKNFIKNICEASENTFKLLQNLLEWSRTQTGNIKYKPERIDINNIVNENISIFQSSLKNKRLSIDTEIPFNAIAFADENMIKTVIRNLLSNAIKFTKLGGEIKISTVNSGNYVEIRVKDNGMGIGTDNLGKLFRIDDQYRTLGTMNEAGSGLGLLLCKEFVEKNKGQIKAESTIGVGSVFSFTLPIQTA